MYNRPREPKRTTKLKHLQTIHLVSAQRAQSRHSYEAPQAPSKFHSLFHAHLFLPILTFPLLGLITLGSLVGVWHACSPGVPVGWLAGGSGLAGWAGGTGCAGARGALLRNAGPPGEQGVAAALRRALGCACVRGVPGCLGGRGGLCPHFCLFFPMRRYCVTALLHAGSPMGCRGMPGNPGGRAFLLSE